MATWTDLQDELDRWQASQIVPTLWWRDDDAQSATPQLEPLIGLSRRHRVPVHLAVIPRLTDTTLSERLQPCDLVHVMQHGFAHENHEPRGRGASEFGDHRDIDLQLRDLRDGWRRLADMRLPNLLPGVVPPWNRMSDRTLAQLPALGYSFVSAFAGPTSMVTVAGLTRFNAHVDPIRWRHGKGFRGADNTLKQLTEHLAARRRGRASMTTPTGLLTHHLETGPEIWDFLDELFDRLGHQGIARWIPLVSRLEDR